jgi:hypothetical protein
MEKYWSYKFKKLEICKTGEKKIETTIISISILLGV